LKEFDCLLNPVADYIGPYYNIYTMDKMKRKIDIINRFSTAFYSNKFRVKLRDWLWVHVREPKIKERYSPDNLRKLLETYHLHKNIDSEMEQDNSWIDCDEIIENW
jgi:hypothetical protein